MFHQCSTNVSPVSHQFFTSVSPMFQRCFISASKNFYKCLKSILRLFVCNHSYPSIWRACFFTHSFKPFRCVTVSSIVVVSLVRLIGDQPSPLTSYYLGTCYVLSLHYRDGPLQSNGKKGGATISPPTLTLLGSWRHKTTG